MALSPSERRAIMKSVQRGRRVDDPARARMAVKYAINFTRRCWLMALVFSLTAVSNVRQLARGLDWFRVVFALLGVLLVLVWFYLGLRSRRSLRLNQALRAEHALPH
jgi:hypothetical protein